MKSCSARLAASLVFVFVLILTISAGSFSQNTVRNVPEGQPLKIQGIVLKRNADSFRIKDVSNVETVVQLTPATEVKTHKKGVFRGDKSYGVSYILRGLRLEATGVGNSTGQLVASLIRFDEQDLRTAQALQSTVDPVEEKADKAQATADTALKSATIANNRINGLDDYDPVRTFTIYFQANSAVLLLKSKKDIDGGAAWTKTQNTKGWVVEVVGFADTTGNTAHNRALSERRANAVIGYLVTKHNLPLQRLVQPFGYGDSKPAASNDTAAGRAKNRRVEIRLLVNKGIAGTTD